MSGKKMLHMANQIAQFFETSADDGKAEAVAEHINKFWAPDMRQELLVFLANDPQDALPLVRDAAKHVNKPG